MNFNEYTNLFRSQSQMKCTWVKNVRLPEEALKLSKQTECEKRKQLSEMTNP